MHAVSQGERLAVLDTSGSRRDKKPGKLIKGRQKQDETLWCQRVENNGASIAPGREEGDRVGDKPTASFQLTKREVGEEKSKKASRAQNSAKGQRCGGGKQKKKQKVEPRSDQPPAPV